MVKSNDDNKSKKDDKKNKNRRKDKDKDKKPVPLPVEGRKPAKPPLVGVQIEGSVFSQAQWLGANSLVKLRVRWDLIEIVPGAYAWDALDRQVNAAGGRPLLLSVIGTPQEYRIFPQAVCSPPTEADLYRLKNFVRSLVRRYGPLAVELWNEPEVSARDALAAGLDQLLGGFGMDLAGYYGKAVKEIGRALRNENLPAWLLAGGLLLDDPRARFWRIARQECAGWFDGVSFHSYSKYPGVDLDLIGKKAAWLREVGLTDKLWVSETALMSSQDGVEFRGQQAAYFDYALAHLGAWGVLNMTWYPLANNGWMCTDMVIHSEAMPVWYEYKKATG